MQENPTGAESRGFPSMGDLLERLISQAESEQGGATEQPRGESVPVSASETAVSASPQQSLTFDPKLLALLPQLMSGLRGGSPTSHTLDTPPSTRDDQAVTAQRLPSVSRHMALISALKPYLGPERRQAAEGLLGMCRTLDTLQKLGVAMPIHPHPLKEQNPEEAKEEV